VNSITTRGEKKGPKTAREWREPADGRALQGRGTADSRTPKKRGGAKQRDLAVVSPDEEIGEMDAKTPPMPEEMLGRGTQKVDILRGLKNKPEAHRKVPVQTDRRENQGRFPFSEILKKGGTQAKRQLPREPLTKNPPEKNPAKEKVRKGSTRVFIVTEVAQVGFSGPPRGSYG